jgi:Na+-driven multidrug efflux pump
VFIVAPAGTFWRLILDLVEAPPEVQVHALPYLRVLFVFGAPLFLSFMFTGAFQATGDAKTPPVLGILATFLNVGISAVLITGADLSGARRGGGRPGTVLAPLFTVSISIALVLRRKMLILPPAKYNLVPDLATMKVLRASVSPRAFRGVAQYRRDPRHAVSRRDGAGISAPAWRPIPSAMPSCFR